MIARFYNIEKIRPSNTKTMYTWIAFDNVVLKWSGVCIRIWIIWIPDVATVLRNCWSTGLVNENATDAKPFPCALQWKFHYWSNMLMKINIKILEVEISSFVCQLTLLHILPLLDQICPCILLNYNMFHF